MFQNNRGVTLVEILIAAVIIILAIVASFSFFSYGKGGIHKQGNRRAAIEVARERIEELMAANLSEVRPPAGLVYWLEFDCATLPCWDFNAAVTPETVLVNDLAAQRMETTAELIDDPSAGTATFDAIEFGVKVWFTQNLLDDDFNRVHLRTIRMNF